MRLMISASLALSLLLPVSAPAEGLSGAYLAGRQAISSNDYAEAAVFYSRALAQDRSNPALAESAVLANIGLGRVDDSVPLARILLDANPGNQVAQMVLTAHALNSGADISLLDEMAETGRIGPLIDGLLVGWGWLDVGDVDRAMAAFDEIISNDEYVGFGTYQKALAYAYVGNFEETVRLLVGDEAAPGVRTRRSVIALALSLGQLGQTSEAAAVLAENFDLSDPEIAAFYTPLAAGNAVPFDMIRSPQDGMGEAFFSVALALRGQAADGFTLLYARFAQFLSPNNADATILTARLLEELGQYDLAIQAYDQVSRDSAAYMKAEIGRAEALNNSDKPDAAIEVLTQLSETRPGVPLVYTTLGDTHRRMSAFEAAAEAYDRAISLYPTEEPSQWFVYYSRGIANERTNDWPAAEADFRKALELNPGQPNVLNYLGYSLVEKRENLDEALKMIRDASAARPQSGYIADSLGWVFYRLGRFDEGVGPMEHAVSLLPIDPVINDHLGDVYWAVGRKREAEFQWSRALSFVDPDDENSEAEPERIQRKLEVGLDVVLDEEGAPSLSEKADGAAERASNDDG